MMPPKPPAGPSRDGRRHGLECEPCRGPRSKVSFESCFSPGWSAVTNIAAPFISLPTRNIPPFLRIPQDGVSKGPGRRQVAPGCAGRAGGGHAPAVRQVEAARPPKGALPFVTLEGSESPEVEDVLRGENVASVDFLFHPGCVRLLGPPPAHL